jgi:hypothetical protein
MCVSIALSELNTQPRRRIGGTKEEADGKECEKKRKKERKKRDYT